MIYKILRIEEDVDFGCEERGTDTPVLAVVTLEDEHGEQITKKIEDAYLYAKNINEGEDVYFDENGNINKKLGEDWTKNCSVDAVDTTKFVEMMEKVKSGQEVDWICPFCGGKVSLLEQKEKHSVIGCGSCDMRITLDN